MKKFWQNFTGKSLSDLVSGCEWHEHDSRPETKFQSRCRLPGKFLVNFFIWFCHVSWNSGQLLENPITCFLKTFFIFLKDGYQWSKQPLQIAKFNILAHLASRGDRPAQIMVRLHGCGNLASHAGICVRCAHRSSTRPWLDFGYHSQFHWDVLGICYGYQKMQKLKSHR